MRIITSLIFVACILKTGLNSQNPPKHEMRGVWIATVSHIDWPSKAGLSSEEQQFELNRLLDLSTEFNLNTIILQVRPAADAFYASNMEPWSQYLTGVQGNPPYPFYDPLEFAIEECRRRGLDIHLWLNPYRAKMDTEKNILSENHPIKNNPEWFVTYGKMRYFNPGLQETRNHVTSIVADLVRRYDIDAIHMDDYFYPYRIAGLDFPDGKAFAMNSMGFKPSEKDAWRRNNVDLIIKQIRDSIKAIKPHVEFGISPFGVWRNSDKDPLGSKTKAGVTNYDDLYADVLKWQKEGWIDYVAPQLYWHIGMEAADYAILADWWSNNTFGCPLYIGHSWYRIDPKSTIPAWQTSEEIIRQVNLNRQTKNISGSMFFSANNLLKNPLNLKENLIQKPYKYKALPPVNNRIKPIIPEKPRNAIVLKKRKSVYLNWDGAENSKAFVVYKSAKKKPVNIENPEDILLITGETALVFEKTKSTNPRRFNYIVTALSPTNFESKPVVFKKK